MKRTLLEILSALTVLVLLASFHHQIAKLKINKGEVSELKKLVDSAVENTTSKEEITELQQKIVERMETRLHELEERVSDASLKGEATTVLKQDLHKARQEAAVFKAQIGRDLTQTRKLVDAYQAEVRAHQVSATETIQKTRNDLQNFIVKFAPDAKTLSNEMLSPAVQLNGDDTVGSGTLIYSAKNPATKQVENYVITAYHVVRNILADTPRAKRDGIAITIYQGKREEVRADLVTFKAEIDTAVLKLRNQKIYPHVARILTPREAKTLQVWDGVCAVGCPLGNDPIPTHGEISSMRNELNGSNYWMINAPTYFGNSGGGIYLARNRSLVGVFSKIYTHGRAAPVVIPHMGLLTPMPTIRKWLRKEGKEFVLDMPPKVGHGNTMLAPAPK